MASNQHRLGVGIVGVDAGRSWASLAHIPALRALPGIFQIVGVANRTRASAQAAAVASALPRAFDSVSELVAAPDVDIVAVTVRVPHHLEIVRAAIAAGKHVYCEWPLAKDLAEASELAELARKKGVLAIVGTQARVAPELRYLRQLLSEGYVGEVLSTTLTGWGSGWGAYIGNVDLHSYLLDRANGANLLTIPVGHTLAAVRDVFGDLTELSAILATRRREVRVIDSGQMVPMTASDQVLISGLLDGKVPLSFHYRGGMPRDGAGLAWEINGTEGDIRIIGPSGHTQMIPLEMHGGRGEEKALRKLEVPASCYEGLPATLDARAGNVARIYARMANDLKNGTRTAPSFDDAVELHRLLEAIETAAADGQRVLPKAPNRQLP